jgi:hypothetical protein
MNSGPPAAPQAISHLVALELVASRAGALGNAVRGAATWSVISVPPLVWMDDRPTP